MGKITLVTGGSRSGKSTFAEKMLSDKEDVLYIATSVATDEEMKNRIKNHRNRRNSNWGTYEGFKELDKVIKLDKHKYIILECIGTMVTNIMFDKKYDFDTMSEEQISKLREEIRLEIGKLLIEVRESNKELIIVTNEVGWSLVSEYRLGRIFSDILGNLNQYIGSLCDEAYLVACGFPLKLK